MRSPHFRSAAGAANPRCSVAWISPTTLRTPCTMWMAVASGVLQFSPVSGEFRSWASARADFADLDDSDLVRATGSRALAWSACGGG